jgi:hypothetical protein
LRAAVWLAELDVRFRHIESRVAALGFGPPPVVWTVVVAGTAAVRTVAACAYVVWTVPVCTAEARTATAWRGADPAAVPDARSLDIRRPGRKP